MVMYEQIDETGEGNRLEAFTDHEDNKVISSKVGCIC